MNTRDITTVLKNLNKYTASELLTSKSESNLENSQSIFDIDIMPSFLEGIQNLTEQDINDSMLNTIPLLKNITNNIEDDSFKKTLTTLINSDILQNIAKQTVAVIQQSNLKEPVNLMSLVKSITDKIDLSSIFDSDSEPADQNLENIKNIPSHLLTKEICLQAVKANAKAIKYIPDHLIDYDITIQLCTDSNPKAVKYLENRIWNLENCVSFVLKDPLNIQYIPDHYLTKAFYLNLCSKSGDTKYVPKDVLDKDICLAAINTCNINGLKNIPFDLIDKEICLHAVQTYEYMYDVIPYIPKDVYDDELVIAIIKKDHTMYKYLPKNLPTDETIISLINENSVIINYISVDVVKRLLNRIKIYNHKDNKIEYIYGDFRKELMKDNMTIKEFDLFYEVYVKEEVVVTGYIYNSVGQVDVKLYTVFK
jgi:hypothetical protein